MNNQNVLNQMCGRASVTDVIFNKCKNIEMIHNEITITLDGKRMPEKKNEQSNNR